MTRRYSFHQLLEMEVEQDGSGLAAECDLAAYYDHYLRHFRIASRSSPVAYRVRAFDDFVLPRFHRDASNIYLGFDGGVSFLSERYAITLTDGTLTEYTDSPNRATNLWLQTILVRLGFSLVHGAGFSLNGKGVLVPAFGGAGKTMLMAALRRQAGFTFFGDDYVAVDGRGVMYSYPSDLSVYEQHLELFPELVGTVYGDYFAERERRRRIQELWDRLPPYPRLRRLMAALRWVEDPYRLGPLFPSQPSWCLDYVKVPVQNVIDADKIGISVPLSTVLLLSRWEGETLKVERLSVATLVQRIAGILHVEFRYGLIYLHALEAYGQFDRATFEERQRRVLADCFSGVELYEVLVPKGISPQEYAMRMPQLVGEVVGR